MQQASKSIIFFAILATLTIGGTIFRGMYHLDPLHWGLMLSNAQDLATHRKPYEEIYIQYGILTTIVHSAAYLVNKSLLSLIFITATLYYLGLIIFYCLCKAITLNQESSIKATLTAFLFHPIAIYPWPNYIAFPFLLAGIYLLIFSTKDKYLYLGGVLLGLSILSRENLIFPVFLIILMFFFIDQKNKKLIFKRNFKCLIASSLGVLIPILLFIAYLNYIEVLSFWIQLSIELPKIYTHIYFPHLRGIGAIFPLTKAIISGVTSCDFRWILAAFIIIANAVILFMFFVGHQRGKLTSYIAKLSCASLILFSGAVHSPEIFRIATGSIVGLIPIFAMLANRQSFKYIYIIFTLGLAVTTVWRNPSIMYFPDFATIQNAKRVEGIEYFQGNFWNIDKINYYKDVIKLLKEINHSTQCTITRQYNDSGDGFMKVLSPYEQRQMAPWALPPEISALRPELIFLPNQADNEDTLLIRVFSPEELLYSKDQIPENYYLYKAIKIPDIYYLPGGHEIFFMLPKTCMKN